jgi:hypothetical protein
MIEPRLMDGCKDVVIERAPSSYNRAPSAAAWREPARDGYSLLRVGRMANLLAHVVNLESTG